MNQNRKFQYGDGFFETMIVENGQIRFFDHHLSRIHTACEALRITTPENLKGQLERDVLAFAHYPSSRVKVQFWREEQPGYFPTQHGLQYGVESRLNEADFFRIAGRLALCKNSVVTAHPFSSFKCVMLPYILASIEKQETNADDLMIRNTAGQLTECISSNLFWYKNDTLYTPALETGCINGVMRRAVLDYCQQQHIHTEEVMDTEKALKGSNAIFCSNATGFTFFREVEGELLPEVPNLLKELAQRLQFGVIG